MSPTQLSLRTILLCDYALTGQDGKISAVGIFGQINVSRLPAVHPRLFIVAVMDAEPGPHDLTLQVLSPNGGRLLEAPPQLHMEVPQGTTIANIVADLNGLELRELGRHEVELREEAARPLSCEAQQTDQTFIVVFISLGPFVDPVATEEARTNASASLLEPRPQPRGQLRPVAEGSPSPTVSYS